MSRPHPQMNNPALYRNANKPDIVAVIVALVMTFLIHALVIYSIPFSPGKIDKKQKYELEIVIEEPKFERRLPETVEANPFANNSEAPKNAPQSFMNQRVADEVTDPNSKSKMPYVEGEIKNGKKIVQGTNAQENAYAAAEEVLQTLQRPLQEPVKQSRSADQAQNGSESPAPANPNEVKNGDAPKKNISQTSGGEKSLDNEDKKSDAKDDVERSKKGGDAHAEKISATQKAAESGDAKESPDSVFKSLPQGKLKDSAPDDKSQKSKGDAEKVQKKKSKNSLKKDSQKNLSAEKSVNKQELKKEKPQQEKTTAQVPQPKSRPMLSMKTPAGPLADNRFRASQQGTMAVDSKFSEFGAYQQRMIEAISRQWNLIGSKYDLSTAIGTQIVIEFRLNTMGELTKIDVLFSNSTNLGRGLCEQSILSTAPYGEWTGEMVAALGTKDCPVRITFFYR